MKNLPKSDSVVYILYKYIQVVCLYFHKLIQKSTLGKHMFLFIRMRSYDFYKNIKQITKQYNHSTHLFLNL